MCEQTLHPLRAGADAAPGLALNTRGFPVIAVANTVRLGRVDVRVAGCGMSTRRARHSAMALTERTVRARRPETLREGNLWGLVWNTARHFVEDGGLSFLTEQATVFYWWCGKIEREVEYHASCMFVWEKSS
jgi:hypothetical protein